MAVIPPTGIHNLVEDQPDEHYAQLDTWIKALHYKGTLFYMIMMGKLSLLSENDRTFFLHILSRSGFLHSETGLPRIDILTKLKRDYGFDINCLNDSSRSILSYVTDPSFYNTLKVLGAKYIHPNKSELAYILSELSRFEIRIITKSCLEECTVDDLRKLDHFCVKELLNLVEKYEDIRKIFGELFLDWQFAEPFAAARFFSLSTENPNPSVVDRLIKFIEFQLLTGPTIEAFCGHFHLLHLLGPLPEEKLKKLKLRSLGPYSVMFHAILKAHPSDRDAIWCLIFLKSTSIKELGTILQHAPVNLVLHPQFQKICTAHLSIVHSREQSTVWMHLKFAPEEVVLFIEKFEISPKKYDSFGRSLLFTSSFCTLADAFIKEKFDLKIRDIYNNNPLDHFILYPANDVPVYVIFKRLIGLGLIVSPHLPHYEVCYNAFPQSQIALALMIYLLNAPNFKKALTDVTGCEYGQAIIDKLKSLSQFLSKVEFLRVSNSTLVNWEIKYPKEIVVKLRNVIGLSPSQLSFLPTFFSEKIPDNLLTEIPESLDASLFCSILQNLEPAENEILHELIVRLLRTHDTVVQLFQYFFQHPSLFSKFFGLMKVTELQLYAGGIVCATYIHDLKTIMMNLRGSCRTAQTITRSNAPIEIYETFSIPNKTKLSIQNQTLLISGERTTEVIKFLPRDRSIATFLTECSAMNTIVSSHQWIESFVPRDIKVRVYQVLPQILPNSLKEKLLPGPYLAHHFTVPNAETQKPFLTLDESSFTKVTATWERDYVNRVIQKEVPKLLPTEGRLKERKGRIILNELWAQILNTIKTKSKPKSSFVPVPYLALNHLEINASGLSNLTNIYRKDPIENDVGDFFNPMEALTKGMEQDVVNCLIRYKQDNKEIRWDNKLLVEDLATKLLIGFSRFCTYSEKTQEEFLGFLTECKIDWKRMAGQILFWADTSSNGYIAWLKRDILPAELFDSSIRVKIHIGSFDKYINKNRNCFELDGEECFGIPKGPSGWVDFHKAAHLLFFMAVILPEPLKNTSESNSRRGLLMTYPSYNL